MIEPLVPRPHLSAPGSKLVLTLHWPAILLEMYLTALAEGRGMVSTLFAIGQQLSLENVEVYARLSVSAQLWDV
jgi:hypothetical protein